MNAVTTVQNKLIIRTNDKFLIFDVTQLVDNGGFHDLFFDLVSAITNTLSANKIDKRYYAELNLSGAKGVIVYRAGIELIGLDMEQLIKSVVASFEWEKRLQGSLQIERQEHKPGELDNLGFNPTLKIPVMNVVFERDVYKRQHWHLEMYIRSYIAKIHQDWEMVQNSIKCLRLIAERDGRIGYVLDDNTTIMAMKMRYGKDWLPKSDEEKCKIVMKKEPFHKHKIWDFKSEER